MSEAADDGLGAVVTGADRDPFAVERLADLPRGCAVEDERQHGGLLGRGADQLRPGIASSSAVA